MWLAKRTRSGEPSATLGQVTILGGEGVALEGERRNVPVCSPGGYHWTPKEGDSVLVVKCGAENAPCVAGQREDTMPPAVEVWISVAENAGIRLKQNGDIVLKGNVQVDGVLSVNGTAIGEV